MNYQSKSKEKLIKELLELQQKNSDLIALYDGVVIQSKKTEDELNEINRRLIDAQSVAKVGSWETDLSNFEVKWSEETFRIFELDPLIFHPTHPNFMEFVHPDDRESVDNAFLGSIVNPSINTIQHRILTGKRNLKFIEENWRIYYNDQGQAIRALGTCSDITERKRSEELVEMLKKSIDVMQDGAYWMDEEFNFIYINEAGNKTLGYSNEELIGKSLSTINYSVTSEVLANVKDLLRKAGSYHSESIHRRKDGTEFPVEISTTYVKYGSKEYFCGFAKDISNRKIEEATLIEAKQKAEESEIYFRSIFENSPNGLSITSFDGSIQTNKAFSDLIGYSYDEFQAKTWMEITHPDDIQSSNLAIETLLKGLEKLIQFEKRYIHKNGSIINAILTMTLHKNDLKQSSFIITSIVDISKLKQAEIELKKSEEKYRFIFDNALEGIYRTSIDGKSLMANPALVSMLGYNSVADYLREMNDSANQVWFNADERSKYIALLENSKIIQGYECQLKRKDGTPIWVSLNAKIVLDDNGNKIYSEGFIEEITIRKKAEIELIAAKERAEESDRLKSAFLANMSHEIRTPMNGILGFSELLKEPKLTGEEQQEYISIIEKSGTRMLNIINDIVDISKIESGQIKVYIEESNINGHLDYISTFFKPDVEAKGMKLLVKYGLPAAESVIKADNEKVIAILTNLVKNAIKYSDKGTIQIGYLRKGLNLEFFVKDQGIGIPLDRQKAIFERFIQADMGDKRAYEGAGLGLSITKSYVEMLGGQIWLRSKVGKGTSFYFTLPYATEPVEEINTVKLVHPEELGNQIKLLKILIAEDNIYAAKLLELIVKKLSREILIVETGRKAVEVCRNNPDIDLILMDIKMPGMDGYEATRQIRLFNKKVVIIAQTAFALIGDEKDAIVAGCNDYISKPVNKVKIAGLIQKYFKN